MLVIKDNVKLKDLKNFGFEDCKESYFISFNDYDYISICVDTRTIRFVCLNNELMEDLLYDLIQAGLVEKVE